MQHYGLPTRLLDWSRSPLISAFFAVDRYLPPYNGPDPTEDAAIWTLAPHELNRRFTALDVTPAINSHACLSTIEAAFFESDAQHSDGGPATVMAAMASETDMRMFVQQGCFTIHSTDVSLEQLKGARRFLEKLTIPAASILHFAEEVDICGIRQGDIFPDLEHLAAELRHSVPSGNKSVIPEPRIPDGYASGDNDDH